MGKLLKDEDLIPDLIMSSTAVRAKKTAELVAKACNTRERCSIIPFMEMNLQPTLKSWKDFPINI